MYINDVTIGNKTLTWMNGRELSTYSDGTNSISYKYNLNGIRTSKVVNGKETKYYLEGSSIIFEDRNGSMIYYIYNGDELLGFIYNSKTYYYHKNIFGDIIGILDSNYNEIVSYEYDSWGALVNITDNSNINLGTINQFRYRSYYYDEETSLYYLNSRYYNPEWGRFINGDNTPSTGQEFNGMNMFCYCGNNPIARIDNGGESWLALSAGVGFVVGVVNASLSIIETISTNPDASAKELILTAAFSFGTGFATGFIAASPLNKIGKGVRFAANIAISIVDAVGSSLAQEEFNPIDFTADVITGVVTSAIETEIMPTPVVGRVSSKVSSKRGKTAIVNSFVNSAVNTVANIGSGVYNTFSKTKSNNYTSSYFIRGPLPLPGSTNSTLIGPPKPVPTLQPLPNPFDYRNNVCPI